jgi:NAD+ kinase
MQITNCLVIVKQTALAQGGRAASFARSGDATAKRILHADAEHWRTVDAVREALTKRKLVFAEASMVNTDARIKGQLAISDLVITVGGDGTALSASHYIRGGQMLGVNSAPGDSVGHFCSVNRKNFAARLDSILAGKWKPKALARLQVTLDEKPLPELALNDVLIAHECPASTTRYLLKVGRATSGKKEEEHRSSGIWISTAAGSTAGIGSAGGKKMPLGSKRIQYLVRELYREPKRAYALTRGFVEADDEIVVASKMSAGEMYIDGAKTRYDFPFGTRAKITIAEHSLKIFLNN